MIRWHERSGGCGRTMSVVIPIRLVVTVACVLGAAQASAQYFVTERVSVASDGAQGNAQSNLITHNGQMSADGRMVVFSSRATTLVLSHSGTTEDIFLRDRQTGTTTLATIGYDGTSANGDSSGASISADGRWVAFTSRASNLLLNDNINQCGVGIKCDDVYLYDAIQRTTTKVSANVSGPSYVGQVSSGGRYVVFESAATFGAIDMNGSFRDVFLFDARLNQVTLVSHENGNLGQTANANSQLPSISGDERFVSFESRATNLTAGHTGAFYDVFVYEIDTGEVTLASLAWDGQQGTGESRQGAISWDGRYVAFHSGAASLVPNDTNGVNDIFLRDRRNGTTTRVSVSSSGVQANAGSNNSTISSDARWIAFHSDAALASNDTRSGNDIYVHDMVTGNTILASVSSTGTQGNGESAYAALSGNGRFVCYRSAASNFVGGDTNAVEDVFVTDLRPYINDGLVQWGQEVKGGVLFYNPAVLGTVFAGVSTGTTTWDMFPLATRWSPNWTVLPQNLNEDELTDFFLYNKTTGSWYDAVTVSGGGDAAYTSGTWSPGWTVVSLDLNGDGRSDVFAYNATTGDWFKCLHQRADEFTYVSGKWSAGWQISPANLNGDPLMDLFLYNPATGAWYWAISGAGSSFVYVGGMWSPNWSVSIGDFDASGQSDAFVYNTTTGAWFLCKNNGLGFDYLGGTWSPGWTVQTGDFDGDGRTDLFVYNPTSGRWYECITKADLGVGPPVSAPFTYAGGGTWSPNWQVSVSDFNGDRLSDLLVYNSTTGAWVKCVTTGPGTFDYPSGSAWSPGWTIITR